MTTLTLAEAKRDLDDALRRAQAGEKIGILVPGQIIVLKPENLSDSPISSSLAAFRRLQQSSTISPEQARKYCAEIRDERHAYAD